MHLYSRHRKRGSRKRGSRKRKTHRKQLRMRRGRRQRGGYYAKEGDYVSITDPQFTGLATIIKAEGHTDSADNHMMFDLTIKPADSNKIIKLDTYVPHEYIKKANKPNETL